MIKSKRRLRNRCARYVKYEIDSNSIKHLRPFRNYNDHVVTESHHTVEEIQAVLDRVEYVRQINADIAYSQMMGRQQATAYEANTQRQRQTGSPLEGGINHPQLFGPTRWYKTRLIDNLTNPLDK